MRRREATERGIIHRGPAHRAYRPMKKVGIKQVDANDMLSIYRREKSQKGDSYRIKDRVVKNKN